MPTKEGRTVIPFLVVALPLLLVSLVSQASGARTTFPGRDGLIVFESDRDGDFDLYTFSRGRLARLVARADMDEFNAAWSPSGDRLVFETGRQGGDFDIALVNANGSGFRTLVGGATNDFGAQFCDANTIVFTRQETPTNSEVYRVETNGSDLTRLTNDPARDSFPTCSPDGRTVAFISSRDGGVPGIFGIDLDRGDIARLVVGVGLDPDFSPDGQSLMYVAPDANRNLEIFLARIRGTRGTPVQLTSSDPPFEYRQPEFLPSSTQRALAYVATLRDIRTGAKEVRRFTAGSERTIAAQASSPSVQPRRPCVCQSVDAVIEPNSLNIVSDSTEGVRMVGRLRWALDCSFGVSRCEAVLSIGTRPVDLSFAFPNGDRRRQLDVSCRGPCARRTRGTRTFQLVGGRELGRDRRGTRLTSVSLVMRRACGPRSLRPREFRIVFADNGRIDRSRSDLNGDGRRDGRD